MKNKFLKHIHKHKQKQIALFILVIFVFFSYQNCSQVSFEATDMIEGQILEGYINGINFTNEKITFQNKNGYAIFEGDIILGKTKEVLKKGKYLALGTSYSMGRTNIYIWRDGVIPYELAHQGEVPDIGIEKIQEAIDKINAETVLTLKPRTNESNYIYFANSNNIYSGSSYVGAQLGGQPIFLGSALSTYHIIHEIFHSAGLGHEQSRKDRDNYINILTENISEDAISNFNQFTYSNDLGSYDYDSIMHYSSYVFTKNGQPTITKKNGEIIAVNKEISEGDKAGLASIYPSASAAQQQLPLLFGNIEEIKYSQSSIIITGAACDKNSISPVTVELYKFNSQSGLQLKKSVMANNDHNTVSNCGSRRNIGFKFVLDSMSQHDILNQKISAYVSSTNGQKHLISNDIFVGIKDVAGSYNMDKDLDENNNISQYYIKGGFTVYLQNEDVNYDIINYSPPKVVIMRKNPNNLQRNIMALIQANEETSIDNTADSNHKRKYFTFNYTLPNQAFEKYKNEIIEVSIIINNRRYALSSYNSEHIALNSNELILNGFGFSTKEQRDFFGSNQLRKAVLDFDKDKNIYFSWYGSGADKITLSYELVQKIVGVRSCSKYPNYPDCIKPVNSDYCGLELSVPPHNKKENSWNSWEETSDTFSKKIHLSLEDSASECLRYGTYKINLTLENNQGEQIKDSVFLTLL